MNFAREIGLGSRHEGAPASPLPLLVAALVVAAIALAVGYAAGVTGPALALAPIVIAFLGTFQSALRWMDLVHRRGDADQWLRHRIGPVNPVHAWRAAELTCPRERRLLARSLRGVRDELGGRTLPGASPLNRVGLRPHAHEIELLVERLADLQRPVSPAGILLIHDLLTNGGSPLYDRTLADALPAALTRTLDVLGRVDAGSVPRKVLDGRDVGNRRYAVAVARRQVRS